MRSLFIELANERQQADRERGHDLRQCVIERLALQRNRQLHEGEVRLFEVGEPLGAVVDCRADVPFGVGEGQRGIREQIITSDEQLFDRVLIRKQFQLTSLRVERIIAHGERAR